ncbi:MAG: EamA family transporter [Candidatus Saccharimonadales bacterium]
MPSLSYVTFFALIAAISWGIGDFFGAKAAKNIGPVISMFAISMLELPIFVLYYLLSNSNWIFNGVAILYACAAGFAFTIAGVLFFKGLNKGPVSLVSPIASMYPLITTVAAIIIFNSHVTHVELLGILLILVGVLSATGLLNVKKSEHKLTEGIWLAVLTALLWGIAFALFAQSIKRIGWQNSNLIEIPVVTVCMLALIQFIKGREVISLATTKKALVNKFVILSTILGLVGLVSITVAIARSAVSGGAVATAISSCYPIITIFLALNHFKERVKPIALAGACVGIVGVILLSIN